MLGPRLDHPAVPWLLRRYGSPAVLRKAGRRRLVELICPKAPRLAARLIDDVFDALDEQTVLAREPAPSAWSSRRWLVPSLRSLISAGRWKPRSAPCWTITFIRSVQGLVGGEDGRPLRCLMAHDAAVGPTLAIHALEHPSGRVVRPEDLPLDRRQRKASGGDIVVRRAGDGLHVVGCLHPHRVPGGLYTALSRVVPGLNGKPCTTSRRGFTDARGAAL